jgi:hypothetical protein
MKSFLAVGAPPHMVRIRSTSSTVGWELCISLDGVGDDKSKCSTDKLEHRKIIKKMYIGAYIKDK